VLEVCIGHLNGAEWCLERPIISSSDDRELRRAGRKAEDLIKARIRVVGDHLDREPCALCGTHDPGWEIVARDFATQMVIRNQAVPWWRLYS
jgi:hypothetical protein